MITLRAALPSDCDMIAEMVRDLARDIGAAKVPKVTGDMLRLQCFGDRPLVMLSVAGDPHELAGACVAARTFSTWRGARGLYIVDLYVKPEARNGRLGERLLRFAARRGWEEGARFIRLEVDRRNQDAGRFYARLGFCENTGDAMWAQEEAAMRELAGK